MKDTLHHCLLLATLASACPVFSQTLTDVSSIPAIGTVENRSYYQDGSANGLATSGAGNTWNAMGVTPFGIMRTVTYHTPGDSPYAANYPTTTICAEDDNGTPPAEWRHFHVSSSIAELLGASSDEFVGGRTYCEFPFSPGGSFTDSYTIGSTPYTDEVVFVASGEIAAPWGTIPDVVMFQINGGPYTFYQTGNLLDPIGSYMPGFGLDLWQVDISSGITEPVSVTIGIWPVPAGEHVSVASPFNGSQTVVVIDAEGRSVRSLVSAGRAFTMDIGDLVTGVYTVVATDAMGKRAVGRLLVR